MVSIINSKIPTKKTMNPYYHCRKTRRCSNTKTVIRILSIVAFMTVIAAVSVSVRSDEKVLHKTLRGVEKVLRDIHGPEHMISVECSFKGVPLPDGVCGWKPYIH